MSRLPACYANALINIIVRSDVAHISIEVEQIFLGSLK